MAREKKVFVRRSSSKRKADEDTSSPVLPSTSPSTSGPSKVKRTPFHFRSSMEVYLKDRKELGLRDCHRILMRTTPFSPFADSDTSTCFPPMLLEEILSTHCRGNTFKFGNKEIMFTVEEVGLILGLPCGGLPCKTSGPIKKSKLSHRFGEKVIFDRKKARDYLKEICSSDEPEDVANAVRLWIVLLFCTFLCPRSAHSCPQQFLRYLDDLDSVGKYNWSAAVHELMMHNIDWLVACVRNHRSGTIVPARRRSSSDSQQHFFLFGCAPVLAVWFLEHTRVRQPIRPIAFPRFFRWASFGDRKLNFSIAELSGQQIVEDMHMLPAESATIYGVRQADAQPEVDNVAIMCMLKEMERRMIKQDERLELLNENMKLQQVQIEELKMSIHGRPSPSAGPSPLAPMGTPLPTASSPQPPFQSPLPRPHSPLPPPPSPMPDAQSDPPVQAASEQVDVALEKKTNDPPQQSSLVTNVKERKGRRCGPKQKTPYGIMGKSTKGRPAKRKKKVEGKGDDYEWVCKEMLNEVQNRLLEDFIVGYPTADHDVHLFELYNGIVLRKSHVFDLLCGHMIEDTVIDAIIQRLHDGRSAESISCPWTAFPTIVVNFIAGNEKLNAAQKAKELRRCTLRHPHLSNLATNKYIFFVLHSANHWHLLVVHTEKKMFISYNSLNDVMLHRGIARQWADVLRIFLKEYGAFDEPERWGLEYDLACPQQSEESLNCGLYVVKYIEALSTEDNSHNWKFGELDCNLFRANFAATILAESKK